MAIKTSDLNARLFGKADKRHVATTQEAQKAAKDQVQIIELAVAGEDLVTFELLKVPADKIEHETSVFTDNAREQAFLNEHALSDILSTLRERGQQYPAVGRKRADGKNRSFGWQSSTYVLYPSQQRFSYLCCRRH